MKYIMLVHRPRIARLDETVRTIFSSPAVFERKVGLLAVICRN